MQSDSFRNDYLQLLQQKVDILNNILINVLGTMDLSFFLILGDTRSLCMPALRPASQAGPMRNPRKGTSVVLCDTIKIT